MLLGPMLKVTKVLSCKASIINPFYSQDAET